MLAVIIVHDGEVQLLASYLVFAQLDLEHGRAWNVWKVGCAASHQLPHQRAAGPAKVRYSPHPVRKIPRATHTITLPHPHIALLPPSILLQLTHCPQANPSMPGQQAPAPGPAAPPHHALRRPAIPFTHLHSPPTPAGCSSSPEAGLSERCAGPPSHSTPPHTPAAAPPKRGSASAARF